MPFVHTEFPAGICLNLFYDLGLDGPCHRRIVTGFEEIDQPGQLRTEDRPALFIGETTLAQHTNGIKRIYILLEELVDTRGDQGPAIINRVVIDPVVVGVIRIPIPITHY